MVVMLVDKSRKIAVIEHLKILESWSRDAGNTEIDVHHRDSRDFRYYTLQGINYRFNVCRKTQYLLVHIVKT